MKKLIILFLLGINLNCYSQIIVWKDEKSVIVDSSEITIYADMPLIPTVGVYDETLEYEYKKLLNKYRVIKELLKYSRVYSALHKKKEFKKAFKEYLDIRNGE